jgi:methylated-DNA-protein-cysteine methyltransferase related protein
MTWQQLVDVLESCVPAGSVTTYAQVSLWGYDVPNKNRPVGALLRGARNNGHQPLTNRVVGTNGELADLPDGPDQQRRQLLAEGVPFTPDGRVDFGRISPVALA